MEEPSGAGGGRRCATVFALFFGRTGLLVFVIGYALFGALLFRALEGGTDPGIPIHIQRSREDCLRELWLITERLNVLYEKNWTRLVTEQLRRFERAVVESSRVDGIPNPSAAHWTFSGALLYSLTLLTTVGYGRLSPRTATGKAVAMVYAIVGVPLMLVLLSGLGSLLAGGARKGYSKLCCKHEPKPTSSVGYHRAPSSPSGKHLCNHDDTVQITQNSCKHQHNELQKKVILATVRASHARGRCRQGPVRQMLADPQLCIPSKSFPVSLASSDVEEIDEPDEGCAHDTPSRIPLIWRPPEPIQRAATPPMEGTPSVPAVLVILLFVSYVCLGAVAFASTTGWSFLDAAYFCFIALSTIGIGDKLPQSTDYHTQLQLLACCVYIFIGLVVVAMCFSLMHDEISNKIKQFTVNKGQIRH